MRNSAELRKKRRKIDVIIFHNNNNNEVNVKDEWKSYREEIGKNGARKNVYENNAIIPSGFIETTFFFWLTKNKAREDEKQCLWFMTLLCCCQ